jgi:hypothetical protein
VSAPRGTISQRRNLVIAEHACVLAIGFVANYLIRQAGGFAIGWCIMTRSRIAWIVLAVAIVFATASSAEARSRFSFGIGLNFGVPCCYYAPAPYYYPAYYPAYYPPPYYYPPAPPAYYAPAYYGPAAAPQCREWRGDAKNEQTGQPFYGTACLQPDGRWHIVRQY